MKKTKSAIRYGMETLRLSPDELFKLIESSQGYTGSDYPRWLASKIIEIAEEDGVLYSQLLVKKFNIINEILEEVTGNQEIRQEYLDIFESCLGKNIYSIDMATIGEPIDVDWYSGLDIDDENSFFVNEKLPVEIRDKILENEKLSFFIKLSFDSPNKKTDLYTDAKGQGISLNSKGAMMLYRICSMVLSFDMSNTKFGIFVPVKFFYDRGNQDIIDYMLSVFKVVDGYSIKSVELSLNNLNSGDMAFLTLEPRGSEDEEQDCIALTSITLDKNSAVGYEELEVKRYSRSSLPMLNSISEESPALVDDVVSQSMLKPSEIVKGYKDALGYLNVNGTISLSTAPERGKQNIAITKENIKDIITYFGVSVSRELEWRYSEDMPCFVNGEVGYEELVYNCIPLFLFDYKVDFVNLKDDGGNIIAKNKLDVLNSSVISDLLDVGAPYFSFEAKELYNLCKDYLEYSKENMGIEGISFKELREMSDSKDFNDLYQSKLAGLKDYINTLSKKYL